MKDIISVIIPVYKVERYIRECLESVLSQDYGNLEVILIDDGSPDDSGKICDEYADKDSRVKVIHQKNGGAAAAKNAGLRMATGEYLSFVDSDDTLEPGAYRYMLTLLQETGADIVQCAFRDVYVDRTEDRIFREGRSEEDKISYLTRLPEDWTCSLLWNKLYKRSLYEGVFFEEGHRIDDEYFTYQGILMAEKIVVDDKIIYNYRRRLSGAMASPAAREQLIFDRADCMDKRRKKVKRTIPELKKTYDRTYLDALGYLAKSPDNTEASIKMLKNRLKAYFREPGNSIPSPYLWKDLSRLLFKNPQKLLAECEQAETVDVSEYFE